MCRHLAYLGPPIPLAHLVFDAPHSLAHQSWAPREMRGGGTINADGFGIAWFPDDGPPVRYRRSSPLWSDTALPALVAVTSSRAFLAAVRSATAGMPVVETAVAPFQDDRWLFSHNGKVVGWPESIVDLAADLPVRDLLTLDAPTDSAVLWALLRRRLRDGTDPGAALADLAAEVTAAAPGSRLNFLLTDGHTIHATTVGHSLSVRAEAGAVTVASEPSDGTGWRSIPDHSLLTATTSTVDVHPLTLKGATL